MNNSSRHQDFINQNFSGQDLRRKNFSGADLRGANFSEADLRHVDFSGSKIRGANFQHANLCEANFDYVSAFEHVSTDAAPSFPEVNFSNSKIKGTSFTNAHLNHANFTRVQAGLTRFWSYVLYIIHLSLCLISAFTATISLTFLIYFFRGSSKKTSFLDSIFIGLISVLSIVVLRTFLLNSLSTLVSTSVFAGIIAIVIVLIVAFVTAINEEKDFSSSFIIGFLLFLILIITTNTKMFAGFEDALPRELSSIVSNLGSGEKRTDGKWISMVLASIIGAIFGCWFSRSAITENTQFNWLWKLYIKIATHGGTLFNASDLTDATFTSANLKGSNFKNAVITRTRWGGARSLEHSHVANSYLKYSKVRQLFLGRRLKDKDFDGFNLEGINLEEVDLSESSFVAANLKFATLKGANLRQANLQQAKLDGTNLSDTCLTGACLQDWTIDEMTILTDIECDHIFLEKLSVMGGRRRFPPDPNSFRFGDFERFFRKDSSVLQLLIRSEYDQQALTAALQQLIKGDHYKFQGFEMIGDDALVKLKVPVTVNTRVVENSFYQTYQAKVEEANEGRQQSPRTQEQQSLEQVILKVFMNDNRTFNIQEGNYIEANNGTYAQHDIINISQDLPQAASQIQDLLDRLRQNGVVDEVAEQQVATDIATEAKRNQTVRENLSRWGASLASTTVSDVVKGVIKLACKSVGVPL